MKNFRMKKKFVSYFMYQKILPSMKRLISWYVTSIYVTMVENWSGGLVNSGLGTRQFTSIWISAILS